MQTNDHIRYFFNVEQAQDLMALPSQPCGVFLPATYTGYNPHINPKGVVFPIDAQWYFVPDGIEIDHTSEVFDPYCFIFRVTRENIKFD